MLAEFTVLLSPVCSVVLSLKFSLKSAMFGLISSLAWEVDQTELHLLVLDSVSKSNQINDVNSIKFKQKYNLKITSNIWITVWA